MVVVQHPFGVRVETVDLLQIRLTMVLAAVLVVPVPVVMLR
jgi:hypothetical protein